MGASFTKTAQAIHEISWSKLEKADKAAEIMGLQINVNKTKSLVFGRENIDQRLQLSQTEVENVQEFVSK